MKLVKLPPNLKLSREGSVNLFKTKNLTVLKVWRLHKEVSHGQNIC